MRSLTLLAFCAAFLPTLASAQATKADTTDPYVWLEEMHGARAMAWVNAENAKTMAVLEKDPRWEGIYSAALAMAQAKDRLPYVSYIGGELYNFWQDSAHVRGIWRKTSLESYRSRSPNWTTVLDLDALAKAEKANWVFHGYTCQQPAEKRCLVNLSDGGEDASTIREFDLASRAFVKDGFSSPQRQATGGVDEPGYDPRLPRMEPWRGDELRLPVHRQDARSGEAACGRGRDLPRSATDGGYGVSPATLVDAAGHRFSFINRPTSTFEAEQYIVRPKDVARLAIPAKGNLVELIGGQVIVHLYE